MSKAILATIGILLIAPLIFTIYLAVVGVEPTGTGLIITAAIIGAILLIGALGAKK
jgi:hypothetical protein